MYPARIRFRGFDEETETAGFKMLSKYLQRVGDQLVDDCEFESEHINLACDKQGFPKRKHNMLSVNDMLEYALRDIDWKLWDAPPECIAEALEKHLVITFDDAKKRSDLCVGRMSDVGWFILKTDGLEPTIVWIEDKESHNYKHTISSDGKVVFFDLESEKD